MENNQAKNNEVQIKNSQTNKGNSEFDIPLIVVSLSIIAAIVTGMTLWPEKGKEVAGSIMHVLTTTFGSPMQLLTMLILLILIFLAFSKYGEIKFGDGDPQFKTLSWVAMMFFCGQGAGTVYWAFTEWGYHMLENPSYGGVALSEAMQYEMSMAYSFYDWGPVPWALLCVFSIPFAYHYHIKQDDQLRLSAVCKYSIGEDRANGIIGKVIDFIFIFSAVGAICITAGTSASTIAAAIAELLGISTSFGLSVVVLLGVAALYTVTSFLGIEKGMRNISDMNVYFCLALVMYFVLAGNTQYILDSFTNGIGILSKDWIRMTMWTDPVGKSSYPQSWTVFYLIYWFVFGPFTGLFVAKISKGRKVKELIFNMLVSGSAGMMIFFGAIGGYQQNLRIEGILDIPGMIAAGNAEFAAQATLATVPFSKIITLLYLVVIVLFLATTLDATSFTLSSTVSKHLKASEEPKRSMKFFWCVVLVAIPIAISYAGTDINTIKALVIATGLPLVFVLILMYHGLFKELKKDFGGKSKSDILHEQR